MSSLQLAGCRAATLSNILVLYLSPLPRRGLHYYCIWTVIFGWTVKKTVLLNFSLCFWHLKSSCRCTTTTLWVKGGHPIVYTAPENQDYQETTVVVKIKKALYTHIHSLMADNTVSLAVAATPWSVEGFTAPHLSVHQRAYADLGVFTNWIHKHRAHPPVCRPTSASCVHAMFILRTVNTSSALHCLLGLLFKQRLHQCSM